MQTYSGSAGVNADLECPSCHEHVSAAVKVGRYYLFVFWLPLLPLNKQLFAHCLSHGAACSDLGTWTALPNAMNLGLVESFGATWDYKTYEGFPAWFRRLETSYVLPLLFALPCALAGWALVAYFDIAALWSVLGLISGWIAGLRVYFAIAESNASGSLILERHPAPPKKAKQRILFKNWRQRRLLRDMEGVNPKANDAAEMLIEICDASIVPDLLGKLYWVDNDSCVWLTLNVLSELGDSSTPAEILNRLPPRVQFALPLTEAFSRLGASDDEWFDLLSQVALDHEYPDDTWDPRYEGYRLEAIERLPRYGAKAIPVLKELAGDTGAVGEAAASALDQIQ